MTSTNRHYYLGGEIVEILKLTEANISEINPDRFEFQIWFGENKW